jgi:GNAT superfamily N-acetyltransferase
MSSLWSLRKYRDGDEQAIFELLSVAFGGRRSLEYWRWKYKKNPAGSPIVWVAEHDEKIIGHYGIIPVRMKIGNMYMTASFACDAAVHPKYQGRGIFSSIVNRCYLDASENDLPLTYGFGQIHLGPTYKRYDWQGHIGGIYLMTRVLNWKPVLNRYVRNGLLRYGLGQGCTDLASAAAQVIRKICRSHELSNSAGVRIEKISRFDKRIDTFWEKISSHFEIITKRDQTYLNWRYPDNPWSAYTVHLATRDKKVLGYCILREAQKGDVTQGIITDILGLQNDSNVVSQLVQESVKYFEKHNVDIINCLLSEKHPYTAIFRKAGFIKSPRPNIGLWASINLRGSAINEKRIFSQALTLSQNRFLKEKKNWFMMSGDGDWPISP